LSSSTALLNLRVTTKVCRVLSICDVFRDTRVVGNFVHELGMYQKQSGAWAQHLAAATHIEANVFTNGPHSAVDFNDGALTKTTAASLSTCSSQY